MPIGSEIIREPIRLGVPPNIISDIQPQVQKENILFHFLHGWGSSPAAYEKSLDAFHGSGITLHAPSIPGHASAPKLDKGSRSLEDVADYLVEQFRALGHKGPVIFAGHSLGGVLSTMMCRDLLVQNPNVSLLLLSPAGANPAFGPRQWLRALSDLKQERPKNLSKRESRQVMRHFLRNSVRSSRLGLEARKSNMADIWMALAAQGVPITAIHASNDRVVDTEPLLDIAGIQVASIRRPHDWPVWDRGAFWTSVTLHLENLSRRGALI